MSETNKYIAITFGPISRVASYAKDTKGIWASSYLFSYIAKQVVAPFKKGRTFLLPWLNDDMDNPKITKGAGVYPDRYVFKAEDGDFEQLHKTVTELYQNLAGNIANLIAKTNEVELIRKYLQNTIKIYAFEQSFTNGDDIVKLCEERLAYMECQDIYPVCETTNYLQLFFDKVNRPDNFLIKDAGKDSSSRLFKTIPEYSGMELKNNNNVEEKAYHKYIAFVKADGDNMTKTISSLKEKQKDTHMISKALFDYSKKVINIVVGYGGDTIFLGGDDLFFIAAVKNGNRTIFNVIKEIDEAFTETLKKTLGEDVTIPTLSFGLSITYHKFPMFEAYQNAENLLEKAKDEGKNCIKWQLRKHSGQIHELTVHKRYLELYNEFLNFVTIKSDSDKNDGSKTPSNVEKQLTSLTQWLEQNNTHLAYILSKSKNSTRKDVSSMLKNYFSNSFNEEVHETATVKEYIKLMIDYLVEFQYAQKENNDNPSTKSVRALFDILKFVAFLHTDIKSNGHA